ncbi:MAG TPA: SDR family NAD(P)-dependent oxidoreductase, partial [Alphaproteobacteria bacterium]
MILVTGAAGFIGFHVAKALLKAGRTVIGVDIINDYYDPSLKAARLKQLEGMPGFTFYQADIADQAAMNDIVAKHPGITHIAHLAAQAGVRYSLENPHAYGTSNLTGQLVMLEIARHLNNLKHFVYASSSSVYGNSSPVPFSECDPCDQPVSLYAATKRAAELMTHSYVTLYKFPATGLRFFTVYGAWGRPDMAYYHFTKAIMDGTPIKLFNNGDLRRDFTYIDDIVAGVIAAIDTPPTDDAAHIVGDQAHRIINLGNHRPVKLNDFIDVIEKATGRK